MEQLFVYGSLKKPIIQRSVFGRITKSFPDILQDFTRSKIMIEKIHPIILPRKGKFVRGLVFSVSFRELRLIDEYETNLYKRRRVVLRSGLSAWVYTG